MCAVGPRSRDVTGRQGTAARSPRERSASGTPGADRPPSRPPPVLPRPAPRRLPQPAPRNDPTVPVRLDHVEPVARVTAHPARCLAGQPHVRHCTTPLPLVETTSAPLVRRVGHRRPQTRGALPPAPLHGTDAALTSVLTAKGPADPSRGALRSSVAPRAVTPEPPPLRASLWRAAPTSPRPPSRAARRRSRRPPSGRPSPRHGTSPAARRPRPPRRSGPTPGRRRSRRGKRSASSRCVRP